MGVKMSKTQSTNSEPNVVPLCDILLVLLIIFMVIMPVSQQGFDIKLPGSDGGDGPTKAIVLSVKESGEIFINRTGVPKPMLESELSRIYENRSDSSSVIFVKGDNRVPFKEIAEVIDIAKGAGIHQIALVPKQEARD